MKYLQKVVNCKNTKSKKLSIAKMCYYWEQLNMYVLIRTALNVTANDKVEFTLLPTALNDTKQIVYALSKDKY